METLAGAPLAIGIEAIKTLDSWLQTEEIAIAWYGDDRRTFCESTISGIRRQRKSRISTVFTVKSDYWEEIIRRALLQCKNWYGERGNGQCCWLPLYRAVESKQRKHFLENAESALSWIGTATSLPAARLESWGLVTLAFADNGSLRVVQDPSGTSYRATFYARRFTLVIRQESLNAPAVAHITLHPHPLPTTEVPGLDWKVLLETGSSIKRDDDLLAWLDNSNAKLKPPTSLLDGTWDKKLKRIIFDYHFTKDMEMQLRRAIFRYYDTWEFALESHPEDGFIRQYATRIMQNLRKIQSFHRLPWLQRSRLERLLRRINRIRRCSSLFLEDVGNS